MTTFFRALTIYAFAVWQGGFFFYATVVVPIGTEFLGSAKEQGAITQIVAWWMNVIGLIAMLLFVIEQLISKSQVSAKSVFSKAAKWRWCVWVTMAILLAALWILHAKLVGLFNRTELAYLDSDRPRFKFWHGTYLWLWSVEWILGIAWLWLTIHLWKTQAALAGTINGELDTSGKVVS